MRITGINNNADSVRVINHGTRYTKAGLLAYARNVNEAKYADIGADKSILTHEIDGGAMRIQHKKPTRKEHTLFINQHMPMGWDKDYLLGDFFYDDIIVVATRDRFGINNSRYADLYDRIIDRVIDGDFNDAMLNYKAWGYKNMTEVVKDYLEVDANKYQVGVLNHILEDAHGARTRYYDEDTTADILTLFTPHTWETKQICGCCPGDWATIIYPADIYSNDAIRYFEAMYFGLYMEYEAVFEGDSCWFTFCDYENTDDIIREIASNYGTSKVKYFSYY